MMKLSTDVVFLFAHQDDEFAVFHPISEAVKSGARVWCLYFTDGGEKALKRNLESVRVLTSLGVCQPHILFVGQEIGVKDGALVHSMNLAAGSLQIFLLKIDSLAQIYTPAWEGGHPDHDALHFVTAQVSHRMGLLGLVRQFSLYNSFKLMPPFFRVMHPLSENGEIIIQRIPFRSRLGYIAACLRYPSQLKTWVGLFPFVAWFYFFVGAQYLQKINISRLGVRPHAGCLYYESRKLGAWADMEQRSRSFELGSAKLS